MSYELTRLSLFWQCHSKWILTSHTKNHSVGLPLPRAESELLTQEPAQI